MKTTFTFFTLLLFTISIFGQENEPVIWSFGVEEVEGENVKLTFTAEIEEGWAIYSQFTDPDGPVPTSFVFEDMQNIELIEDVKEPEEKEKKYDELFEVDVIKIKGNPEFYQMAKGSKGETVKGYVTYMCCDDSKCLPPKDINFEITIE